MKRNRERKICGIKDTGRENVNINRVTDEVITRDKTEYSSQALAEVVDGKHKNDWILIMRSKGSK